MREFKNMLKDRVSTVTKLKEMEILTRGQHDNETWRTIRKEYLTASNFGTVLKKRSSTSCHNFIRNLLYGRELNTPAIIYSRLHERKAKKLYEARTITKIKDCGLFIHINNYFLAASPDGIVEEDSLVEIKCLFHLKGKKLLDPFEKNESSAVKNLCYKVIDQKTRLKINHNYYYQVQGQLNTSGKSFCDFILYSESDISIERIYKDENFWSNFMVPKLERYMDCILPEIIDPRVCRNMKIQDPDWITKKKEK